MKKPMMPENKLRYPFVTLEEDIDLVVNQFIFGVNYFC